MAALRQIAFELERTGAPTSLPALDPVRTYPVTVDGDSIFVEVS